MAGPAHAAPARVRGRRGRSRELPPLAARACHVSQPGLSAQSSGQLEDGSGVRLFERDRRNVWITAAGEEVVRRARAVLEEVRGLTEAARGSREPLRGLVARRRDPDDRAVPAPARVAARRRRFPALRLRLHEGRTAELVAPCCGAASSTCSSSRSKRRSTGSRRARSSKIASWSRCPPAIAWRSAGACARAISPGEELLLLTEATACASRRWPPAARAGSTRSPTSAPLRSPRWSRW